jgi:hypothetical protein
MRASELQQTRMKEAKARLVSLMDAGMILEDLECLLDTTGRSSLNQLPTLETLSKFKQDQVVRLTALGMVRLRDESDLYRRSTQEGQEVARFFRNISKLEIRQVWQDIEGDLRRRRRGDRVKALMDKVEKSSQHVSWDKLRRLILQDLQMSEYAINAFMDQSNNSRGDFLRNHLPCGVWPTRHDEMTSRMIYLDLINPQHGLYWYTPLGKKFHNMIQTAQLKQLDSQKNNLVRASSDAPAPTPPSLEEQQDISLSRDGLVETCSKLWWLWVNGDTIRQAQQARQLKEFTEGHALVEQACQDIATSEQRVSRKLLEAKPTAPQRTWSEEEQRRLNDMYWMSDKSAFWLNPHGELAEPTPAPDWWSPPQDLRSITAERIALLVDDTVDRSLLPPPQKNDSFEPLAGIPSIPVRDELKQPDAVGADQESDGSQDLVPTDYQNSLAALHSHFVKVEFRRGTCLYYACTSGEQASQLGQQGVSYKIAARGDQNYGPFLRAYERQVNEATAMVNQIKSRWPTTSSRINAHKVDDWNNQLLQQNINAMNREFTKKFL